MDLRVSMSYAWEDYRIELVPSFTRSLEWWGVTGVYISGKMIETMPLSEANVRSGVWYPTGIKGQNFVDSEKTEWTEESIQYVIISTGSSMVRPVASPNTTVITVLEVRQITVPCDIEPIMFPFDTHNCEFGFSNEATQSIRIVIPNVSELLRQFKLLKCVQIKTGAFSFLWWVFLWLLL